MTRSKLSASDREELIRLFKETTETITSLANQFQVSISTARRVLKTQLSAEEYETIVTNRLEGRQHKKSGATPTSIAITTDETDGVGLEEADPDSETEASTEKPKIAPPIPRPKRRSRRRSSAEQEETVMHDPIDPEDPDQADNHDINEAEDLIEPDLIEPEAIAQSIDSAPRPKKRRIAAPSKAPAKSETPVLSDPDALDSLDSGSPLEVLPIETATLPNQCYLVVDRASELITPPLREFAELGQIPTSEESAKTLPIFENHKIASRFSRRSQRIIKIPNSDILKKTYSLLNAKGVERILFDGQVFSLSNRQP